ncbi:glycogen synthase GlgA [Rhodobacter sp. 24-YEA-8]|uniref:glycogen synthase GlgA n=1 Tax=Rhodobacter sp. 24-YEA-8 TaxID=1884310 RepID=UPI000B889114|nr:glycogen synthase GlgA [Rhodobacter sp. 24-YEA-8]
MKRKAQMGGRVLSVASEAVPLVKTGGLADVVGALPEALAPAGWEMRVMLPAYRALRALLAKGGGFREVMREEALFGGEARVFAGETGGLSLFLLDAPHLFDREGGPYHGPGGDWGDNPQRFAALSWMAARVAREGVQLTRGKAWKPDVLHAHDWQTGLAPAYLAYHGSGGCASVITVHNIAFQGHAPARLLGELRLPAAEFHADALEYYGGLSLLKAGLITADRITTVSPNYAAELMRPEFGLGLQGVLAARSAVVSGIVNGIDTRVWSPEAEIVNAYSATSMSGKAEARAALQAEFGLSVPGPLAVLVSRLTDQKGVDLLPAALPDFIEGGGGLAVLGSGDAGAEAQMLSLAARWPGRVSVRIGYDEGLSHRLFQGGDAVLVPSRFEPCGLTQMYGLRYGTIPVVAAVGGLADTVIPASPAALNAGVATGITFWPTDVLALTQALRRLNALYADQKTWARLRRNAMEQENGWAGSARAYAALYEGLLR